MKFEVIISNMADEEAGDMHVSTHNTADAANERCEALLALYPLADVDYVELDTPEDFAHSAKRASFKGWLAGCSVECERDRKACRLLGLPG